MKIYQDNFPSTISNAIYNYGDNSFPILEYGEIDENHGYLYTDTFLCLGLETNIKIEKNKLNSMILKDNFLLQTDDSKINTTYIFDLLLFFYRHDISIQIELDEYRKLMYYGYLIIYDLLSDNYEDIALTSLHRNKLEAYKEKIEELVKQSENLPVEVTLLAGNIYELINELEIDSDEVDLFEENYQYIQEMIKNQKTEMDSLFENHKDKIQSMLGISMDDLKNKSPEELNQLLDDLCDRFHISKDQLFELARRFGK